MMIVVKEDKRRT